MVWEGRSREAPPYPDCPFLARAKKVSPPPSCAAAQAGAASIAFGSQIAIEAAVVAELENSKEK